MDRIAGKEYAVLLIFVGNEKILPPRVARQHFIFDGNADDFLEQFFHFLVGVDRGMQCPVLCGILHDEEGRLVVGHVIMAAARGALAKGNAIKQFIAFEQRLTQAQNVW